MSAYVEGGEEWRRVEVCVVVVVVGGGVSVLGSLWVSQVLSGRESGRYLIVIASMERTEAGPVRKFLIYLVFLFSLLFLPPSDHRHHHHPPPPPSLRGELEESGVGGGGTFVCSLGANGERG